LFSIDDILAATGGSLAAGSGAGQVSGVSTDSRTVQSGELFIPLRGERFDGHDYLATAADRGVTVVLAAREWLAGHRPPAGTVCIAVDDTLQALGDLAAFHRRRFSLHLVGVTGSNGKTTTKEMLAAILAASGPGLKTAGNLNNLIGLPRMLLQLTGEHRWAVLEMGMSEPGEIDRLAEIAAPDVGVITNAYPAHLASMGSVAAVARAKGELFGRLPAGGWAVYNADDQLISACPSPAGVTRLGFGLHGAAVTATELAGHGRLGQSFRLILPGAEALVTLHAFGLHNVYNAMAAAAAAHVLGFPAGQIVSGLASFRPYDKRFQLFELGPIVLVDDSYNANPVSMASALLTLRDLKGGSRAIAVLGDMLELGGDSSAAHADVGRLAATCVDRLYLLGTMADVTAEAARAAGLPAEEVVVAGSHEEIVADLRKDHLDGDCILVKGSRGMRMDRISTALQEAYGSPAREGTVA
jgi:UDP-N-acetylmuramoyl-tripeptide--D-alanyl-D-alanine ligase